MPDEPRPEEESEKDETEPELEAELAEFEAALKKEVQRAAEQEPMVEPEAMESGPAPLLTKEEIEARLERAVKDAESFLGPIRHDPSQIQDEPIVDHGVHGEFAERFESVDSRLGRVKGEKTSEKAKQKRIIESDSESARGLGIGMSVAYTIIGLPLAGAVAGWFIDQALGTKLWQGICVLIGGIGGVAMALLMLNRTNGKR